MKTKKKKTFKTVEKTLKTVGNKILLPRNKDSKFFLISTFFVLLLHYRLTVTFLIRTEIGNGIKCLVHTDTLK